MLSPCLSYLYRLLFKPSQFVDGVRKDSHYALASESFKFHAQRLEVAVGMSGSAFGRLAAARYQRSMHGSRKSVWISSTILHRKLPNLAVYQPGWARLGTEPQKP